VVHHVTSRLWKVKQRSFCKNNEVIARYDFLTVVVMKIKVFWDVISRRLDGIALKMSITILRNVDFYLTVPHGMKCQDV